MMLANVILHVFAEPKVLLFEHSNVKTSMKND
jgi:hypothetical protein